MINKLANANLIAKVVALSCFALVTAGVLAVPAANLYSFFYPPTGFIGPPPPIPGIFFLFGLTFSIPFSFGLYGTLGFTRQRKILATFLFAPTFLLYLLWRWPDWELLVQIVSLQLLSALLGFVLGYLFRYAYQKIKG